MAQKINIFLTPESAFYFIIFLLFYFIYFIFFISFYYFILFYFILSRGVLRSSLNCMFVCFFICFWIVCFFYYYFMFFFLFNCFILFDFILFHFISFCPEVCSGAAYLTDKFDPLSTWDRVKDVLSRVKHCLIKTCSFPRLHIKLIWVQLCDLSLVFFFNKKITSMETVEEMLQHLSQLL